MALKKQCINFFFDRCNLCKLHAANYAYQILKARQIAPVIHLHVRPSYVVTDAVIAA